MTETLTGIISNVFNKISSYWCHYHVQLPKSYDSGLCSKLDNLDNFITNEASNSSTFSEKAKTERKKTALEEIREQEQAHKARMEEQRKRDLERMGIKPDPEPIPPKKSKKEPVKWIYKKIVVKVMNKKLGEKFYKKKAFIESTDGFVAVVQGETFSWGFVTFFEQISGIRRWRSRVMAVPLRGLI